MIDKVFNRILFVTLLLFVVSIPMTPLITQANTNSAGLVPCGGTDQEPCEFKDLIVGLHNVIEFAIKVLAPVFVAIMVVTGGFYLLTAGPSPGRAARGKEMIKWAVIGYAIIMLSYIMVNTVLQIVGVATWTGLGEWWNIKL